MEKLSEEYKAKKEDLINENTNKENQLKSLQENIDKIEKQLQEGYLHKQKVSINTNKENIINTNSDNDENELEEKNEKNMVELTQIKNKNEKNNENNNKINKVPLNINENNKMSKIIKNKNRKVINQIFNRNDLMI